MALRSSSIGLQASRQALWAPSVAKASGRGKKAGVENESPLLLLDARIPAVSHFYKFLTQGFRKDAGAKDAAAVPIEEWGWH